MQIELGFTGNNHVFACGGGVLRENVSIIHIYHQLWRPLVSSLPPPPVSYQRMHLALSVLMSTHKTHTKNTNTHRYNLYKYTFTTVYICTLMCTDHFSVPVCVSCTFTVDTPHKYYSKQPPCYFWGVFFQNQFDGLNVWRYYD